MQGQYFATHRAIVWKAKELSQISDNKRASACAIGRRLPKKYCTIAARALHKNSVEPKKKKKEKNVNLHRSIKSICLTAAEYNGGDEKMSIWREVGLYITIRNDDEYKG